MPIITDFTRSTQPIVRYRLDDVLVERKSPCPCGSVSTAIERIEGRADDILFLPRIAGGHLMPVMPDFVRDALAPCQPVLSDYRVVQHAPDRFELRTEGADPGAARTASISALNAVFDGPAVRRPVYEAGAPIVRDLAKKLRRVERRFPLPKA